MIRLPKMYCAVALALALMLAVSAAPVLADDVRGTLLTVEPDNHLFTLVDDDGQTHDLRMFVNAEVRINGAERTIWDLQAGDQVTVSFNREEEEMLANTIDCIR